MIKIQDAIRLNLLGKVAQNLYLLCTKSLQTHGNQLNSIAI